MATKYIKDFDVISVRENSGINIVASMGRKDVSIVSDPTLLMDSHFYHNLTDSYVSKRTKSYVYSFFIRNFSERKHALKNIFFDKYVIWNNGDNDYTIQGWLNKIKCADFVVTDSFHCVVMCLKFHVPFIVITEQKGNIGMNDRFHTLLDFVGLSNRIIHKSEICLDIIHNFEAVDWNIIDKKIDEFVLPGLTLLKGI